MRQVFVAAGEDMDDKLFARKVRSHEAGESRCLLFVSGGIFQYMNVE